MSEEEFNKAQQDLIEGFKVKLTKAAEDTIGNLYTDVSNWAATDAHTNYYQFLRDQFSKELMTEIPEQGGQYSWAANMRLKLLKEHPEQIRTKLISDMEERIKSLEDRNQQLHERYR